MPDRVDLRDLGWLAAAEHFEVRAAVGEGLAEIVHELANAATASEALADIGEGVVH